MAEILGTGLSGLVGSRVRELLIDHNFSDLSLETGFNILDTASIEPVFRSYTGDVVIHFAGFTDLNAAWQQKGDKNGLCYQLNVIGTQNIVDLCHKYNKYLIHISTDYVFDGNKSGLYTEIDQTKPLEDWYSETKRLAETTINDSGIPASIVRVSFPYRSHFEPKTDLVRKIIDKLQQNQVCNLFTDQITTPTLIDDIALGLAKFIDVRPNGIYHLVASSTQSVYDMGTLIAKTFGFDLNLIKPSSLADYLKTPDARPYAMNLGLNNQKLITEIGYTPRTLKDGLAELKRQLSPPLGQQN